MITGRSDATLVRGGVRIGTAEFYSLVEALDEVADRLVVHHGVTDRLVLFVAVTAGSRWDASVESRIVSAIREGLSPRHVPDEIHVVPAIPRTLSGKKMEVPVKRRLEGGPLTRVADPGAMANPDSHEAFLAVADASPAVAGD